ncbi:MAG TPA: hypothetical protein VGB97_04920, partial [Candidatus Paceibacterota bacterium]
MRIPPLFFRAGGVITAAILITSALAFSVHAAWNGAPYLPGETLNPECPPTNPACRVLRALVTNEGVAPGALLYTETADSWRALPVGSDGSVLTTRQGRLSWEAALPHDPAVLATTTLSLPDVFLATHMPVVVGTSPVAITWKPQHPNTFLAAP